LAGVDLLGGRTVEVVPGTSEERLVEGQVMPGESVSGVMELADEIGSEARLTMTSLRGLLDEQAVADLHGSLADLRTLIGSISEVVETQREELTALSSSLNRSAGQVEELTGSEDLRSAIERADSTLAELTVAGQNLARATTSLETILGRVERGEGTLGLLVNDETLYRSMNTALEELTTLAREIRENPGDFVRLRIF
jgi:phospholipid/cholesterol/gamma-HCH transport system substrate-binding protein